MNSNETLLPDCYKSSELQSPQRRICCCVHRLYIAFLLDLFWWRFGGRCKGGGGCECSRFNLVSLGAIPYSAFSVKSTRWLHACTRPYLDQRCCHKQICYVGSPFILQNVWYILEFVSILWLYKLMMQICEELGFISAFFFNIFNEGFPCLST